MSKAITDTANYTAIADAIRDKGVTGSWKPSEMPDAIGSIETDITADEYPIGGSLADGTATGYKFKDGITKIKSYAFRDCTSLVSVDIPESVNIIDNASFYNCQSLTTIKMPTTALYLESYSFYNCQSLTSIIIPKGLSKISDCLFCNCSSLNNINIPSGITKIGTQCFQNCYKFTEVNIPSSVVSIGSQSFYGCSNLILLDMREVTAVPTLSNVNAFTNTASTLQIVVPDSLYSSFIAASNWSSLSSKIVKMSDYTG